MHYRFLLVTLLVLMSLADRFTLASSAQDTTYTDPFAYCAAVSNVDAPDARYAGPNMPDAIVRGLQAAMQVRPDTPLDPFRTDNFWRCMNGKVYACTAGANLPCEEKADTSQTPSQAMTSFCQVYPNADIPAVAMGRATVYEWQCQNGVATIIRQFGQVDARGFLANIWYEISRESVAGPQTMPDTGRASGLRGGTAVLVVLSAVAALLGMVFRRRSQIRVT